MNPPLPQVRPLKEKRTPKPLKRGPGPKRKKPVRKRSAKRASVVKADAAWADAVKERAGDVCELPEAGDLVGCGWPDGRGPMEAHHVKGKKAFPRLRYDIENGVSLCPAAHDWAHANRDEFKAWFSAKHPERWARLRAKAQRESRLA